MPQRFLYKIKKIIKLKGNNLFTTFILNFGSSSFSCHLQHKLSTSQTYHNTQHSNFDFGAAVNRNQRLNLPQDFLFHIFGKFYSSTWPHQQRDLWKASFSPARNIISLCSKIINNFFVDVCSAYSLTDFSVLMFPLFNIT